MPRYRRARTPGATYFFTVVTHYRRKLLIDDTSRKCLRNAVEYVRLRHPFDIDAWVLMPDHMHCMWTLPADDADFSKRWGMIKANYRHMDYIHWNPVKHGLAERVIDWPYSSFHRCMREGVYSADWGVGGKVFDRQNFGEVF